MFQAIVKKIDDVEKEHEFHVIPFPPRETEDDAWDDLLEYIHDTDFRFCCPRLLEEKLFKAHLVSLRVPVDAITRCDKGMLVVTGAYKNDRRSVKWMHDLTKRGEYIYETWDYDVYEW